MPRNDGHDLSRHNTVRSWELLPRLPLIAHKITEGRTAVDPTWRVRWPHLLNAAELVCGYHVLHASSARAQLDNFARQVGDRIGPAGTFVQVDWEPWEGHPLAPAERVLEFCALLDQTYGPNRWIVYANPNQLGAEFDKWRRFAPDAPLWLPDYRRLAGPIAARTRRATVHQWTDRYASPAFAAGVCANEITNEPVLRAIAGRDDMQLITDAEHYYDTRRGDGGGRLAANVVRRVELGVRGRAVTVNVQVVNPTAAGFLHAFGSVRTAQSRITYAAGETVAADLLVPLDGEAVNLVSSSACDVVLNRCAVWS